MRFVDAVLQLLLLVALAAATAPWLLEARPSEALILAFALAPPVVLGLLLGLRERRERAGHVHRAGRPLAPAATD